MVLFLIIHIAAAVAAAIFLHGYIISKLAESRRLLVACVKLDGEVGAFRVDHVDGTHLFDRQ